MVPGPDRSRGSATVPGPERVPDAEKCRRGTSAGGALAPLEDPVEQEKTGCEWMKLDEQQDVEEGPEEPEETRMAAAASAPSKQMREEHEAQNHAVFRSWCEICVQSRGLGTQHRKKKQMEAIEDGEGLRFSAIIIS